MPSHQSPDGRWHHTFSASWLKDFATCPEKARRRYFGVTPNTPTSYTALGSAVHAGIEAALNNLINSDDLDPVAVAHEKLWEVQGEPGYTPDPSMEIGRLVSQHIDTFQTQTLPHLHPLVAEEQFDLEIYSDAFRTIRLRGAIDCVDRTLGIIDWKTANNPHKVWEKERYEVQPVVYVWAWNKLQGTHHDHMRYVVFIHDKGVQEYTVNVKEGATDWLAFKCLSAARLVESGLPVWAMNDSGWWCAKKWCPAWDGCKGSFVKEEK